jgi:altronate dehydratase large subunit
MNNRDHFCIIKFQMADNVGIALTDLQAGKMYPLYTCQGEYLGDLRISEVQPPWSLHPAAGPAVPRYHKVATRPIAKNDPIIKDAVPIGLASEEVMVGQLVHQHIEIETGHMVRRGGNILEYPNLFSPPPEKMATLASAYTVSREGYDKAPPLRPPEMEVPDDAPLVSVYRRPGGVSGTRLHILVIPAVFCVNQEALEIAEPFRNAAWGENAENYVHALTHSSGCCQIGFDEEVTLRTLTNMACHPNVGGVLIVSLGCSPLCVNDRLYESVRASANDTLVHHVQIQGDGRSNAVLKGRAHVRDMITALQARQREKSAIAGISLSVKCGGSDPTSGLFSNSAIGHVADWFLDRRATVVISEIMEYFGAERILNKRCRDHNVWLDLLRLIKTNEMIGKAVAVAAEQDLHSVELTLGNMKAGLSTQEEKSLGAIRKMGFRHPIENVVRFADRITGYRHGLYVMDGPGQDLLSASGMAAGGCQAMLFSTGIGTPLGNAVTPVIKITGNEDTFSRHGDFIDVFIPFHKMLQGGMSAEEITLDTLLPEVIAVLEGKRTKAEQNRHRDFAIRNYMMVQ